MEDSQATPRGIKNNNPLNLRRSDNAWLGKIEPGTDKQFEQFVSMIYGIRAAMVNMRTIIRRQNNHCTLAEMITTWAPPSDGNKTADYINFVARHSGVMPTELLNFKNKEQIVNVTYAMSIMECGVKLYKTSFETAYEMLR